jgi:EAL domain-containing protein (putative c-di-GMP-specific phosphodiesterase class I)
VLERAVAQVRPWRQSLDPAFQISINMPPAYLEWCADHPADALQALSALEVPSGSIVLEITEGAFLNVTPEVLQVLALLKGMGFGVALDDFGVGYSSFGQLDRLPLDTLKIDKSLVDHIEAAPTKRAVCAAIIKVGQELGCKVVAEGVETAGQQALLAQAGCDFVQGYLVSRPLPAADFESFVKRWASQGARVDLW